MFIGATSIAKSEINGDSMSFPFLTMIFEFFFQNPANLSHIYDKHLHFLCDPLLLQENPRKRWPLNFEDLDKAGKHGSTAVAACLRCLFWLCLKVIDNNFSPTSSISVVFPVRIIHQHQIAGFFGHHIRCSHRCLSVGKPNGNLGCLWVDIPICQGFCNKKITVKQCTA